MNAPTLQDGLRALVEQYGADTVAAAVALLISPVKECKRCGHTWTPRQAGSPKQCPACHSVRWNRPRHPAAEAMEAMETAKDRAAGIMGTAQEGAANGGK